MPRGIIIFGASGCGTSTIGRGLAHKLGYMHFETDDFSHVDTHIPHTKSRPLSERINLLQKAMANCDNFVISGSMWDWCEPFIPYFELAVFVTTPTDIRINRLEQRELMRYGKRICEGGDLYDNHRKFIEWSKTYDTNNPDRSLQLHEEWITSLPCSVLRIDGTATIDESIAKILVDLIKT